jgi:hypothetical protein
VPGGEELAWEAEFAKEEEERLIYAVYVAYLVDMDHQAGWDHVQWGMEGKEVSPPTALYA